MEQHMTFRIFDHLLVHHGWTATGRIAVSDPLGHAVASSHVEFTNESLTAQLHADIERRSLLARLVYRGKPDPILCRAARRLQDEPSLSIERLAAELGVSERYLSCGLQAALGQRPDRLFG
jgi:AraC-like DNA-binding protein